MISRPHNNMTISGEDRNDVALSCIMHIKAILRTITEGALWTGVPDGTPFITINDELILLKISETTVLIDVEDIPVIDYVWHSKGDSIVSIVNNKEIHLADIIYERIKKHNPPVDIKAITIDTNDKIIDMRRCKFHADTGNSLSIRNNSGVTGVRYSKSINKWVAQIQRNKILKKKHFETKEEAIAWRKEQEVLQ